MIWAPFLGGTIRQQHFIVPRLQRQQDDADAIYRSGQLSRAAGATLAEQWPTADKWPTTEHRW